MERVAYVPSKHIYWLPDDPNHYFRFQETIVIVLIAVKLGGGLKKGRATCETVPRFGSSCSETTY